MRTLSNDRRSPMRGCGSGRQVGGFEFAEFIEDNFADLQGEEARYHLERRMRKPERPADHDRTEVSACAGAIGELESKKGQSE
jgi:hypothetical protein